MQKSISIAFLAAFWSLGIAVTLAAQPPPPVIYIAGDSTAKNTNLRGWVFAAVHPRGAGEGRDSDGVLVDPAERLEVRAREA